MPLAGDAAEARESPGRAGRALQGRAEEKRRSGQELDRSAGRHPEDPAELAVVGGRAARLPGPRWARCRGRASCRGARLREGLLRARSHEGRLEVPGAQAGSQRGRTLFCQTFVSKFWVAFRSKTPGSEDGNRPSQQAPHVDLG